MVSAPAFRAAGPVVKLASTLGITFDVPLPAAAAVADLALLMFQGGTNGDTTPWTLVSQDNSVEGLGVWKRTLSTADVAAGKVTVNCVGGGRDTPVAAVVACWSGASGVESFATGGLSNPNWKQLSTSNPATAVYVAAAGRASAFTGAPTNRVLLLEGGSTGRLLFVGDLTSTGVSSASSFTYTSAWYPTAPARLVLALAPIPLPAAPDLSWPTAGLIVRSGRQQWLWRHNAGDPSNGTQSAYSLRLTAGGTGAVTYYDQAADAWTPTLTWNVSAQPAATPVVAAGGYSWSVATRESVHGGESPFAANQAVLVADPPTVAVTAPVETVSDATVAWTTTLDPVATAQTGWVGRVWTAAQAASPLFDPDTTVPVTSGSGTSETSWAAGLLSPGAYRVGVMARETGGIWSAWAYKDFTMDAAVSGTLVAPTLAAAAGFLPSGAPAVELTLTGVGAAVQVDYSDDGVSWLRASGSISADGSLWDATAPLDGARQYRARVSDGARVSAWSPVVSASLSSTVEVLVDLTTGWAVPGRFVSDDTRTNPAERDVMSGLGSVYEIVSSDVTRADRGSLTVRTRSLAELADVLAVLARGLVMLRWTPERDVDGDGPRPADDVVQVTSDISRERLAQTTLAYRTITFGWTRQPAPPAVLWVP